ncbi:hypothetical protein PI125_g10634 [Phytophthora idaei]|nr:hypothetical protein PI125_g10634 [Phytophthora idaei]
MTDMRASVSLQELEASVETLNLGNQGFELLLDHRVGIVKKHAHHQQLKQDSGAQTREQWCRVAASPLHIFCLIAGGDRGHR